MIQLDSTNLNKFWFDESDTGWIILDGKILSYGELYDKDGPLNRVVFFTTSGPYLFRDSNNLSTMSISKLRVDNV